jgi:magnesium-transporting ATPase (P-type)
MHASNALDRAEVVQLTVMTLWDVIRVWYVWYQSKQLQPIGLLLPKLWIISTAGAGLHTAASTFWDCSTDGSRTVRWENKTMWCITTVFGLSL